MDRISEIMQAVYSLARLDMMFTGFSEMTGPEEKLRVKAVQKVPI